MTLQQQAVKEISSLSEEELSQVIQFMNFLHFTKTDKTLESRTNEKRYRTRGRLSGKIVLADDFHETPDCFEEYM